MMDLEKLLNYDAWANDRIFEALKKLSPSKQQKEIKRLFSHLLTAQNIWLNRIQDKPIPSEIWPHLSIEEMEALINETPAKLRELLPGKDELIQYQNSKGVTFQNSAEDILMHLVIHGQHHRAQIATLLRQAGETPPATDFIFFLRTLDN